VVDRAQQSATHHTGKTPEPAKKDRPRDAVKLRQAQLSKLKKDLAKAVEAESYEAAAKLRDEIRTLEEA
jgi:protein-arginine kinase activator protein McsA